MKRVILLVLAIAGVCCFIGGCETEEYAPYGKVKGVVLDGDIDVPIENATVYFHEISMSVLTDERGEFMSEDLKAGNYTMLVQKAGYQSNHKEITIRKGEILSTVITIKKIPNY